MIAICLQIFHTLTFDKIKQLFLSPFIFTQIEKDNFIDRKERKNIILTENGKCHLLFDFLSLLENCLLSVIGSIYIAEVEDSFVPSRFYGIVIGTHVLGLLLKFGYYRYQHPWMALSPAHYCMDNLSKTFILLFGVSFMVGMPIIGHLYVESVTTSTILYISTGFCAFWVSIIDLFENI